MQNLAALSPSTNSTVAYPFQKRYSMGTYRQEYTVLANAIVTNADGKTTFQFRTPSEGGVEL